MLKHTGGTQQLKCQTVYNKLFNEKVEIKKTTISTAAPALEARKSSCVVIEARDGTELHYATKQWYTPRCNCSIVYYASSQDEIDLKSSNKLRGLIYSVRVFQFFF